MHILAIDTSTAAGSVAALDGQSLLGERSLETQRRTAQTLAPAISQLLQDVHWKPSDIQLIAVTRGPGSFTGLRLGVTTAKSLAYAVGAEVIGLNALDVILAQARADAEFARVCAVMDAHRQQLFSKTIAPAPGHELPQTIQPTTIVGIDQWLDRLSANQLVTGPGLRKVQSRLPGASRVTDPALWTPQARTVGVLAHRSYQRGARGDLWSLVPNYYRPSAAEEKASAVRHRDST